MHVLPTYVFCFMPNDLNIYIGSFLIHPETEIRSVRSEHIADKLYTLFSSMESQAV